MGHFCLYVNQTSAPFECYIWSTILPKKMEIVHTFSLNFRNSFDYIQPINSWVDAYFINDLFKSISVLFLCSFRLVYGLSDLFQSIILMAMLCVIVSICVSMLMIQIELVTWFSFRFRIVSHFFSLLIWWYFFYNFSHVMKVIHWWSQYILFKCALYLALHLWFVKLDKDWAAFLTKYLIRSTNSIGICSQQVFNECYQQFWLLRSSQSK